MAQALTVNTSNKYLRADMEDFKLVCDWQGTSDMAVSLGIAATVKAAMTSAPFPEKIKGKIAKIETAPGYLGDKLTYCPYGTYAVTLLDSFGVDVLDGTGAARSTTASELVVYDTPVPVDEELTLTIASTATTDQLAGRGAFTGAATGWTLGAGWAYGTDNIAKTAGTGTASDNSFAAVALRVYELTFTVSGWAAAVNRTLTAKIGNVAGTAISADGTYTQTITAANTNGLVFTPTGTDATNVACVLDSVTVKYLTPKGRVTIFIV
jgi:hypothetical protein